MLWVTKLSRSIWTIPTSSYQTVDMRFSWQQLYLLCRHFPIKNGDTPFYIRCIYTAYMILDLMCIVFKFQTKYITQSHIHQTAPDSIR